jgi:RHS repeat-associated protein
MDETGAAISRSEYLPYGEAWVQTGDKGYAPKYNGQELDGESDFYYYNARHYDPQIGRFISADTVVDGATTSAGWNRYMYVHGNPVMYKDPSGHDTYYDKGGNQVNDTGTGDDVYMFMKNNSSAPTKMEGKEAVQQAAESNLQKAKDSKIKIQTDKMGSPLDTLTNKNQLNFAADDPTGIKSGNYANRTDPLDASKTEFHPGVDLKASAHTPIKAVADGKVTYGTDPNDLNTDGAIKRKGYGNWAIVEHGNGVKTLYGHMHDDDWKASRDHFKTNNNVIKGETIGGVGSTGGSTGDHLHFEIRTPDGSYLGKPIDPEPILKEKLR